MRQQFRGIKKRFKESFSALADNIEQNCDQWLEAAKAQTTNQIKQFLMSEHFLNLVPNELKSSLMEKHYTNLQQIAVATDELWAFRKDERQKVDLLRKSLKSRLTLESLKTAPQEIKCMPFSDSKGTGTGGSHSPLKCFQCGGDHL